MKIIIFFTILYSVFCFADTKLTVIDVVDVEKKVEIKTKPSQLAQSLSVGIFANDPFKKNKKMKRTKKKMQKNQYTQSD